MFDGIKRKCVQCGEIYVDGSRTCPCCNCNTRRLDGREDVEPKKGTDKKRTSFKAGPSKTRADKCKTRIKVKKYSGGNSARSCNHTAHISASQPSNLNISNHNPLGCGCMVVVGVICLGLIIGLIMGSVDFCSTHSFWDVLWSLITFPFQHPIWALVIFYLIGVVVAYLKGKGV